MSARQANEDVARARANEVLEDYNITTCPVQPEEIAAQIPLPIDTRGEFPPRAFGVLFKEGNDFRIVISQDCPSDGLRRFTLAHELGHFFLDDHIDAVFDNGIDTHISDSSHFRGQQKPWFEREADVFASELLVPSAFARPIIAKSPHGLSTVQLIAGKFETSLSCAAIRYTDLTFEPTIAILSCNGVIEWVSYSKPFKDHWWSKKRHKGEWAAPRSATKRIIQSPNRLLSGELVEADGQLSEWFENAPHAMIHEEALGLGSYGRVLTILTCPNLPNPEVVKAQERRETRGLTSWKEAMRPWAWDSYDDIPDD